MSNVRLKYIDSFIDRYGVSRFYLRKPGAKRIPLPGLPGSSEFMAAYHQANGDKADSKMKPRGGVGTFDALLASYFASPDYKTLAPSTQRAYRLVLERWVTRENIGHRPVATMRREHVAMMMGKMENTPGAANDLLKKIRLLMTYAIVNGFRKDDPTLKMKKYKAGTFHTWTNEEIAQYEQKWPIGTNERLAFSLLLDTGQRLSDVIRMAWPDINGSGIMVRQRKTDTKLEIPIHPNLQEILSSTTRNHVVILVNQLGKPFTSAGFGGWMADKIAAAGLPDRCVTHGLRKAAARRLADVGCSTHEIAAITGHKSLEEIELYTRDADQRRLAKQGIARLSEQKLNGNSQT